MFTQSRILFPFLRSHHESSARDLKIYLPFFSFLFAAALLKAQAPAPISPALREKVDAIVRQSLTTTGVPSASIAIVRSGAIAYLQAYGDARIEPRAPALSSMRYSIGSISKQFAAAAVLLLAEQGKLSLDDPVSRFVPNLTRGNEVTIRELLSHTSGYQDYWPQDYVPPFMLQSITADKILDQWARKALDFDPGTDWQYSNTNFVIAGIDRGEGQRRAPAAISQRAHLRAPGDEERHRHRPEPAHRK